jgi:hypothetical protein
MTPARSPHRVLFLVSAHNSLSQRAYIAVTERGHDVEVAVVDSAAEMEEAVRRHRPDLIVCPMLKKFIPESIWARHRCLVVHPGPRGDRGPSSLDWAIELGAPEWGVTVLRRSATWPSAWPGGRTRIAASRRSAAAARVTRRSGRSTRTAPRRWLAARDASSDRIPATTRRDGASSTSCAGPMPSPSRARARARRHRAHSTDSPRERLIDSASTSRLPPGTASTRPTAAASREWTGTGRHRGKRDNRPLPAGLGSVTNYNHITDIRGRASRRT